MLYKKLEKLSATNFKRYCGVERETFNKMCEIVRQKSVAQRLVEGRPPKLVIEDQILLTLEYWREYRTMFHIGTSWGISESSVSRIITRVEDILTDSGEFALPGKRMADWSPEVEIVVVDVAESPIERPSKKNKNATIRARKSGIRSKLK
jgi:Helix-turn-helix of DDE superfamily endonuclease